MTGWTGPLGTWTDPSNNPVDSMVSCLCRISKTLVKKSQKIHSHCFHCLTRRQLPLQLEIMDDLSSWESKNPGLVWKLVYPSEEVHSSFSNLNVLDRSKCCLDRSRTLLPILIQLPNMFQLTSIKQIKCSAHNYFQR